jgi:RNA 2',3'-cyclic 3'-phosphodiesterase
MRFFVALEIPPQDKQGLEIVQNRLKDILPYIKLTDLNKLHLTLVFVGEQDESLKERLIEAMNKAASAVKPFSVTPSYIDGFPNIHYPHTIWVGVKGDVDKLHIMRERLKDVLLDLNLPVDERRFVPHIAIAKSHEEEITQSQENAIETLIGEMQPLVVNSIKLFESVPDQGLHTHNTLAEIKLS